jgi:hypothetical protein
MYGFVMAKLIAPIKVETHRLPNKMLAIRVDRRSVLKPTHTNKFRFTNHTRADRNAAMTEPTINLFPASNHQSDSLAEDAKELLSIQAPITNAIRIAFPNTKISRSTKVMRKNLFICVSALYVQTTDSGEESKAEQGESSPAVAETIAR